MTTNSDLWADTVCHSALVGVEHFLCKIPKLCSSTNCCSPGVCVYGVMSEIFEIDQNSSVWRREVGVRMTSTLWLDFEPMVDSDFDNFCHLSSSFGKCDGYGFGFDVQIVWFDVLLLV